MVFQGIGCSRFPISWSWKNKSLEPQHFSIYWKFLLDFDIKFSFKSCSLKKLYGTCGRLFDRQLLLFPLLHPSHILPCPPKDICMHSAFSSFWHAEQSLPLLWLRQRASVTVETTHHFAQSWKAGGDWWEITAEDALQCICLWEIAHSNTSCVRLNMQSVI